MHYTHHITISLLVLFLSSFLCAQVDKEKFDGMIKSMVSEGSPGLAVGIVKDGQIVYEGYAGYANLDHNIPIDQRSRFNIASNAKQFTALCILKLQQEGKLSVADDFRKYLPDFYPAYEGQITIGQLINHSSGVRDYCDLLSLKSDPWWRKVGLDNEDVLELLKDQKEFSFVPGNGYKYSNSNYILLGAIVETVSGKPFHEYAREMFSEFGMDQTVFSTNYMGIIPNKAIPYSDWGDGVWQQYPMLTDLHGDGFLYTTLGDQLKWEQILQQRTEGAEDYINMSQQQMADSNISHYGYGLEFEYYLGRGILNHEGATGSYGAYFLRFPQENLSIVVLSNSSKIWTEGVAKQIAQQMMDAKEGINAYPNAVLDKPELKAVTGDYLLESGTLIKIGEENGQLYRSIYGSDNVNLIHETGNVFRYANNENLKIAFVPGDNGTFNFALYLPDYPIRKAKRLKDYPQNMSQLEGTYINDETGVSIEILGNSDGKFTIKRKNRTFEGVLIRPGWLQFRNNSFKFDPTQATPGDIYLDYDRLGKVRFSRVE